MIINDRAKITPLTTDHAVLGPEYQPIATIPRGTFDNNLYDVLGIVLYVGETKEVKRESGRTDLMREVHIIDHSSDRPIYVSLWNEIIVLHEPILNAWADSFTFKGFTMSSTMSTAIIVCPEGPKTDALREWVTKNKDTLIDHRSKLAELHSTSKTEAHNTWQEELFTIKATTPTASFEHMYLYVGCNKCSHKCDVEPEHKFVCEHCANDAIAEPWAVFKVDFVDDTGSIQLPLFVKHVEQLLGLSGVQLWHYSKSGNTDAIAEKMHALRHEKLAVKIGPTLGLTTRRVLSWAVREIAMEGQKAKTEGTPAATDSQANDSSKTPVALEGKEDEVAITPSAIQGSSAAEEGEDNDIGAKLAANKAEKALLLILNKKFFP